MNPIEKYDALVIEASGDVVPDDSLADAQRLVKGAVMCAEWLCRLCDAWPEVEKEIERLRGCETLLHVTTRKIQEQCDRVGVGYEDKCCVGHLGDEIMNLRAAYKAQDELLRPRP